MEHNRYRNSRRNYALPPQPAGPIADDIGAPRPYSPKMVPIPVSKSGEAKVEHLKPVHQTTAAASPRPQPPATNETALIDLNEPNTGGWLDSLAPAGAMQAQQARSAAFESPEAVQALPGPGQTISVQISLPTKIKLPKPQLPALPAWNYRKVAIWAAIGAAGLVVLIVGLVIARHLLQKPPQAALTATQRLSASLSRPSFNPVAPKDKAGLAASQAGSTSYDGSRDVYSYQDTLLGTMLVVSQQPVPAKFNTPSQAVSSIAKAMGAKTDFKSRYGTVYEVIDSRSGAQTFILSIHNVLIFIQSNYHHDTTDWINYINSLQ